jgi:hypothetical protein
MRRVLLAAAVILTGCAANPAPIIFEDNFQTDSKNWKSELENGGSVRIGNGEMDIDVPGGATVWFRPVLKGPILIDYDATAVRAGGPNDRVSDMNCFWMASDARNPDDFFAVPRSGKFADYNPLRCYYASIGGNSNTTTRFRRYIGSATTRPLLPEHDLSDARDLPTPNKTVHIQLIADGRHIEFRRDGRKVFSYDDPSPYTSGNFAIRTTQSHLKIRHLRIRQQIILTNRLFYCRSTADGPAIAG